MLITEKGSVPLYVQIIDLLVSRISSGVWSPGEIIPSEINLAKELDVSQGTVRKAISELVESNVLIRKQGRGTFVSNHNTQRALFHFFHITSDSGEKVLPDSEVISCKRVKATRHYAAKLNLANGEKVIKIERIRKINTIPAIAEFVILPESLFGELGKSDQFNLPNMLYELYETQFGITIHSAEEQLRASNANKHQASLLQLEEGAPLLRIERLALTIDKTPIELRISYCNTANHYYQNTLF